MHLKSSYVYLDIASFSACISTYIDILLKSSGSFTDNDATPTLLLLMRLCFLMSEAREDILLPGGWKGPGFRPLKDMEERFLARRLGELYCTVLYCGVLYLARRSAIWRPDTRGVLSGTMRLMEAQSTAYTLCFCA